jgi:hypothetical protein
MKNFKIGWLTLITLVFVTQAYAQQNPRDERPTGISFYGGGPPLLASVSLDQFVSPKVSIEAGAGAFGVYAGGRYYFKGDLADKRWTFNTGFLLAGYGETVGTDYLTFLPIGYQYIGERGFNFAIEGLVVGESLAGLLLGQGLISYLIPIWPGIKFGYRF